MPLSAAKRTGRRRDAALKGARPGGGWGRSLALGAAAAALSAHTVRRETGPHDEGLMLTAASRVAAGQMPYRDFWANYPPGQPLVLGALTRVRGASLLDWRVLRVAMDAATSMLAHRLVVREVPAPEALLAWAGTAGAMAFPTGPGPNPPAVALTLAALLIAPSHPRRAGALAGAATVFRLELGVAAASGVMARAAREDRVEAAGAALAATAAGLGPFLRAAPAQMASQTIGFMAIQHLQRLPLPLRFNGPWRPSKLIEFYMPVILLGSLGLWTTCVVLDRRGWPRIPNNTGAPADVALAPSALVGAGYLLGRSDEFHLVPLAAVLPVMLSMAAARARGLRRRALLGALALTSAHGFERRAGQARHRPELEPVPGRPGRGVLTSPAEARALRGLLAAVHRLTAPDEAIFVANPRHDLVRVGNPLLYTLLQRPNATRYDVMQPGVVTTEKVQREICAALDASPVRVVVRWLNPTACAPEPNGAGRSSGVDLLDHHLERHYHEVARFGYYAVLIRSGDEREPSVVSA